MTSTISHYSSSVISDQLATEKIMKEVLKVANRAGLAGEPPIAAAIVRDGVIISIASNSIISSMDITAHAEVNVIRDACIQEQTLDLTGYELYTSVEPCQMCYSASQYAGITRIVYGATLADLHSVTNAEMQSSSKEKPILQGGCMRNESVALIQAWKERQTK